MENVHVCLGERVSDPSFAAVKCFPGVMSCIKVHVMQGS